MTHLEDGVKLVHKFGSGQAHDFLRISFMITNIPHEVACQRQQGLTRTSIDIQSGVSSEEANHIASNYRLHIELTKVSPSRDHGVPINVYC